jgi:hypothetical protein
MEVHKMEKAKRWEIALCEEAMVHVHYETGSPEIFKEGLIGLARELREVADQIEAIAANKTPKPR